MTALAASLVTVLAQGDQGTYIVQPKPGLMIWTLIVFFITMGILGKFALPRIQDFLERRAAAVREQVQTAERVREEADEILEEYRQRLKAARKQADDIVSRAHRAADTIVERAKEEGKREREAQVERAKRDIEEETRRSIEQIRREVLDLTILATEKVTRKSLDGDDHERLIEEALEEADFSLLARGTANGASGNGSGSESRSEQQAEA